MRKRVISLIICVVLVLSLMPTMAFADDGLDIEVKSLAELTAALNKTEPVAKITISDDFTVTDDCTIKFDAEKLPNYCNTQLIINENVTLTIGKDGQIGSFWPSYEGDWETPPLPNGKVINNGKIIVENGGAVVADFAENNGEVTVKDGGELVCCTNNKGTVTVEAGGVYQTTQGADARNHGTVTICGGAQMISRFGCSIINEEDGKIVLDGEFECGCVNYDNADHMWFENKGVVEGHGDVILYDVNGMYPLENMDALIENMMSQLGQTTRFENWDDINIYKRVEAPDFETLKSIYGTERTVSGEKVEGNMDTIVVLAGDVTVPDGEYIRGMINLIIPEEYSLTVENGGKVQSGIENYGKVTVKEGAYLSTTMGGPVVNFGTLTVEEGALIESQMGQAVINKEGATMTLNGDFNCGCVNYDNTDHVWFENYGTVNGNGSVSLYDVGGMNEIADINALAETVKTDLNNDKISVGISFMVIVNDSFAEESGEGSYRLGDKVTINAGEREGYVFAGWTSEDVEIKNAQESSAEFEMPDKTVTVTATWKTSGESDTEKDSDTQTDTEKNSDTETDTEKPSDTDVLIIGEDYVYGDVNCDGKVNMEDVTSLQKIIAKLTTHESYGKNSEENSDVTHDKDVNMMDVTTIQKYLAKLISSLDIGWTAATTA